MCVALRRFCVVYGGASHRKLNGSPFCNHIVGKHGTMVGGSVYLDGLNIFVFCRKVVGFYGEFVAVSKGEDGLFIARAGKIVNILSGIREKADTKIASLLFD